MSSSLFFLGYCEIPQVVGSPSLFLYIPNKSLNDNMTSSLFIGDCEIHQRVGSLSLIFFVNSKQNCYCEKYHVGFLAQF